MGEHPERAVRDRTGRDGLAAIAIVLLASALIAVVVSHFV
jgi:hypothetical protein